MARLVDLQRQKPIQVEDNLVNEALASGKYRFKNGIEVPMVSPDGTLGNVVSENVADAISNGFRYRTADEDRARAKQDIEGIREKAYGGTGLAVGLGALRGATLGLSDVALRAGGLNEAAKEVQQRSPTASIVGEVAGGIAGLAVPMFGSPARLAMEAGQAVGSLVKGGSTLNKLARTGAAGVTEGALIGAGQVVSEMALGDPEMTVQKAIGNIGLGAVLGGSLNIAGRATLDVSNKAITGGLKAMADSQLVPKTAKEFAGRLSEIYGKGVNAVRGEFSADAQSQKLFDRNSDQFRATVVKHMSKPDELYRDIAANFDQVRDFAKDLEKSAGKASKVQKAIIDEDIGKIAPGKIDYLDDEIAAELGIDYVYTRPALKGNSLEVAEKKAGLDKFSKAQAQGTNIVADIDAQVSKMVEANQKFGTVYEPGAIRELRILTEDLSKQVASSKKISEINDAIVYAKNEIGRNTSTFDKPLAMMTRVEKDTKDLLLPIWKSLKQASVDKEVYGDLGAAVAERADMLAQIKFGVEDFDKQFFSYQKNGAKFERVADYSKLTSFFKNTELPSKERKRLALQGFNNAVDESIGKLKPIELKPLELEVSNLQKVRDSIVNQKQVENKTQKIDFLERKIARIEKQNENIKSFNEDILRTIEDAKAKKSAFDKALDIAEEQRSAVNWLNMQESFTGKSLHGALIGGSLSTSASLLTGGDTQLTSALGTIGVLGGALLGNPRAGLKFLVGLEQASKGLDRMAENAATKFKNIDRALQKSSGTLKNITTGVRQNLIREKLRIDGNTQEDNEKAYSKHIDDLSKMKNDQVGLYERIYDNVGEDSAQSAPVTTMTMFNTVQNAVAFLDSKIPKDPYSQGLYRDDFIPSFTEIDRYANYSRAIMKPKTIFKELENGQLKPETVEAVRAVYPRVYEAVVAAVSDKLVSSKKLDFDKRVQLGVLFGIPSVKALQPDYLKRMLTIHQAVAQEEQQGEPQSQSQSQMGKSQMVSFRGFKASERQQRNA